MIISDISVEKDFILKIYSEDGRIGYFDVKPYLNSEAFEELKNPDEFEKIFNGRYYIEWECGADLSADSIEAGLILQTNFNIEVYTNNKIVKLK